MTSVPSRPTMVVPERATSGPSIPTGSAPRRTWATILREMAADRTDQAVFAVTALLVGFGYSVLLPFGFTQRLSFANWQYFGARYYYPIFTVLFALGTAFLLTLQVHAMRRLARSAAVSGTPRRGGLLGLLPVVVSLWPSLLCCSPIVPTLIGLLGLSAATQLRTTGTITYFFATKEGLLLLGGFGILVASALWSMRKVASADCLGEPGCGVTTSVTTGLPNRERIGR
jgi:hypothetical protein